MVLRALRAGSVGSGLWTGALMNFSKDPEVSLSRGILLDIELDPGAISTDETRLIGPTFRSLGLFVSIPSLLFREIASTLFELMVRLLRMFCVAFAFLPIRFLQNSFC